MGDEESAPCFSSFGADAKAWCRDGVDRGREAEPMDPGALRVDGGWRCWLAR